jgi:hypothetical protein
MPSPSPMNRQFARSAWFPWARRGYHVTGTEIVRPSTRWTTSVSSVTDTCCARASQISIGGGEVLMPSSQKMLFLRNDQAFNLIEFRSTVPAATSQPYRIEPELRTVCIALDVNVRWLSVVRRIEEEPVGALATNGRHWMSLLFSCGASESPVSSDLANRTASAAAEHDHTRPLTAASRCWAASLNFVDDSAGARSRCNRASEYPRVSQSAALCHSAKSRALTMTPVQCQGHGRRSTGSDSRA